jgi:WD40 repeat protein
LCRKIAWASAVLREEHLVSRRKRLRERGRRTQELAPLSGRWHHSVMGPLRPGDRLGAFRVVALLGQGGMGAVYRAEDATGRPVALKVISGVAGPASLERFHREARLAAEVRHPNVVSVVASGGDAREPFLALELVEGGTLGDLLRHEGRLDWKRAVTHGAEIARGLVAIHAAGLIHRDLKPDNVLLAPTGAKVSDLGLARRAPTGLSTRGLTGTGEVLGTLEYMAPEQLDDAKRVDARADLYALGATLYALVTGAPPFEGSGLVLANQVLMEGPRPPSALAPDVPNALDALILSLLAKSPGDRPHDASVVAGDLEAIASGAAPARPRRSLLPFAIVVGALAFATLAGVWLARGRTPEPVATPTPAPSTPAPERRPLPAECHDFLETRLARLAAVSGRYVDRHSAGRPEIPILGVSISSDGKRCVTAGCPYLAQDQGTAAVWDLATKRVLRRFGGPGDPVFDAVFLPDGEHVVTGSLGTSELKVRSLRDGEPDRVLGRVHTFTIAVSPHGVRIASSSDRGVHLLDAAVGGSEIVLPRVSASDRVGCGRAAFLSDDRIVTVCDDGYARVWDVSKGFPEVVATLSGHELDQNMPSVALSRDGRLALTASLGRGGELILWNLESNKSERSFPSTEYPRDGIRSVAFAATRHLALLSPRERHDSNRLETFDTKTGERSWISTLGGNNDAVAVTPDERLAVCGDQHGTLRIVDLERRLDVEPGHVREVTGVGFLPDGKRVASTGAEGVLRVWDERGGLVACLNGPEHRDRIVATMNALAVAPRADDGRFATPFSREHSALAVFDVGANGPLPLPFDSPTRNVLCAAYSPDGKRLVSGDDDGNVQPWDAETGQPLGKPLSIPGSEVNSVAYSPDGARILASATRGGVRVWNAATGEIFVQKALSGEPGGPPIASAFAGRERIVVGGGSGSLAVWDLAGGSWREVGRHGSGASPKDESAPSSITAVAGFDDGRRAVSAGEDGQIRIWDLAASKELDRIDLRSSEDVATALALAHDGRTLAVGTRRGLVLRFDLTDR